MFIDTDKAFTTMTKCRLYQTFDMIAAGAEHIVLLTCSVFFCIFIFVDSNKLFVWGCNKHAQCILPLEHHFHSPKEVQKITDVTRVFCGAYQTYLMRASGFFTCGRNDSGMLGDGHTVGQLIKSPYINGEVVKVVTGVEHAVLMQIDGKVFVTGRTSYGQTGLPKNTSAWTPLLPKKTFIDVACGAHHTILVTRIIICCKY